MTYEAGQHWKVYQELKAKALAIMPYEYPVLADLNQTEPKVDGRDSTGIQTVCKLVEHDQTTCIHYDKSKNRPCCMYQVGNLFCDKVPGLN